MKKQEKKDLAKIYIPPMAGVTDITFRRIIRHIIGQENQNKIQLATEMISSKGMEYQNNPRRMKLDKEEQGQVVIQIFGHEPLTMAKAGLMAEKAGAKRIEINMGCPASKIVNSKDGASLMRDTELAVQIVKEVKSAIDIPLSVKTRLGWDSETKNIKDFAQKLQEAGIDILTIHGRTRKQGYQGIADWHSIKEVSDILEIPIYTNGDIIDLESAKEALSITNSHGIAVARATMGNPWLIKELIENQQYNISIKEKINILELHIDWQYQDQGERGIHTVKKHIGKYLNGIEFASQWRSKLVTQKTYSEMKNIISQMKDELFK